ncbi:MAG: RNA polymerase sporulation sigma factor SigG [Pseudoflavonifractor capillosus]|uniref:RNA polymerase sporulation sigma factor SigG n=1 Tax=Pseudoflavonifractor capillosus TaxID=106588 RepID=UPI00082120EB|nr:RNA polymerase sporulation sigma factor SigG [Pseudoflavonifractor capillosus]MCI5929418.1 RNA polymerase sporulation sigma factor SigG [Pseudoflavonifractor capillosus]MDY4661161.1 RNA polymerase sporulation sigma factor SigG [Pseudoflavonifractor capillosus]SCI66969.1 Stage II sporulation protein AC [uncultured Flavonifractor sp.]
MQGKVEICGVNTSKLKVLKNEETVALLKRTKEGDTAAREELIAGNLRLVLSVIQKFSNRGENVDDLFQVGCIGLIKAIDNFNTDLDVRFSTYGVPMIVGEIRRYLRDNSSMRVSRSMRDTAYKVLQAKEKFMAEHQREPTMEEIAKMLDLKREDVVFAMDAIMDPVSLYEPVYSDGGDAICVMDQVKDSKNTDESWLEHIALKEAISHLSDRERHILSLRFFEGRTQMEVSAEIGISQAQVSRLEKNAIWKIRKSL